MIFTKSTGVASFIADNFSEEIDKNSMVAASLLHDMGNIIKFKFERFPEFLDPEGLEYWENVKREFKDKYGDDEHEATHQIIEEVGVTGKVRSIVHGFGFENADKTYESSNYEIKIAAYSDMRIAPHTVLGLVERLTDAEKRYVKSDDTRWSQEFFDEKSVFWEKVEKQIFRKCRIVPEDVTGEVVGAIVERLKGFKLNLSGKGE